jgi:hypothetical protein
VDHSVEGSAADERLDRLYFKDMIGHWQVDFHHLEDEFLTR